MSKLFMNTKMKNTDFIADSYMCSIIPCNTFLLGRGVISSHIKLFQQGKQHLIQSYSINFNIYILSSIQKILSKFSK